MTESLRIDLVSDVVCPWCVIGLRGIETALEALAGEVVADIRLQPFELNPAMPFEGQRIDEHVAEKYGRTPDQARAAREGIRERARAVGFEMSGGPDARIYNTFAAHQLLEWAGGLGRHLELKHALFRAYFQRNENLSELATLAAALEAAGLDPAEGLKVLEDRRFAAEVRAKEGLWRDEGVTGVPAAIVEGRYVLMGAQTPEAYARAFRAIAAEKAAAVSPAPAP